MAEYAAENLLPTPSGYATENQLRSVYDYAKALQQQSGQPVRHWTQGVSHMVEALMGGHLAHGADVQGQQSRAKIAQEMEEYIRGAGTPGSASSAYPGPQLPSRPAVSGVPSPTAPTAFAPEEDATPGERFAAATPGVPGATPVKTVPVAPPHPDDPYSMRNIMSWEETDPKTGERTGGGTFDPPPKFAQVPGQPKLPPDAQGMVRALANPTGGQVGGPANNQPGENAALAKMLAGVIRAGGDWREALALVNARQAFIPKYGSDDWGREFIQYPDGRKVLTGRQMTPGKSTKVGEFPAYETLGPDGKPIINLPGFAGSPSSGSPGGGGTPDVGGAPHFPPRTAEEAMRHKTEMEAYGKGLEASSKAEAERYDKRFSQIEKMAEDAVPEIPQLNLLKKVISNPQFYSGIMSGTVEGADMVGKALGITSGQTAALQQLAKKLGSAGSLEQIREMGQQGAVRVPEMHMIEKSNFDQNNLPEANAAVVELRLRLAQRAVEVADRANAYAAKHRGRIDRGFEQENRNYYRNKPLVTDEELAKYEELATRKSTRDPMTAPVSGPRTERWDPKSKTFVPVQNNSSGF